MAVPVKPKTIVSLVPSLTELLFDLGLGDRVVGRTRFCTHPKEMIQNLPVVGGTKNPRLDKIRDLKPDLIIANREENRQVDVEDLEKEFNEGKKTLNALISYDGKKDIVQASNYVDGDSSRESLRENLEISSDIDYVIRTGDNPTRECLSGFPIWNASYAEFYHLKKNFPAVTPDDIKEALNHFQQLRMKKGE